MTLNELIFDVVSENGGGVDILFIMTELCRVDEFKNLEAPDIVAKILECINSIPELGVQEYCMTLGDGVPRSKFFVFQKMS